MNPLSLTVVGSPQYVRVNEGVHWSIDTTNWGGTPTSPSVAAQDLTSGSDVTATVIPGSVTIDGNTLNLPKFLSGSTGHFRLVVTFTNDRLTPAKPALEVFVVT